MKKFIYISLVFILVLTLFGCNKSADVEEVNDKIIEEEVNLNKQSELIDKFINEVGSSQWQN